MYYGTGEYSMLKKIILLISALFIFEGIAAAQETPTGTSTTTTAVKKKRPPIFRPTKEQIKQVQSILKEKKLYTGEANGTYNVETRSGIRSFQKDAGLRETGTLNRATLEKIGVELTERQKTIPVTQSSLTPSPAKERKSRSTKTSTKTDATKVRAPIFRATADQIRAAQKLLRSKSMYSGEETGKLDEATRAGLKLFQKANGLKAAGTLNAETLEKMGIALTDKQRTSAGATPGG
jgi:peptidoglycan hydrolase-like protein with peptidoglycan-binding domain